MLKIENFETGEIIDLSRDMRDEHPEWVHEQMGIESRTERELQAALGAYDYRAMAEHADERDSSGAFMDRETARKYVSDHSKIEAHWDDQDPESAGWVATLTRFGGYSDDSAKIWFPGGHLDEFGPEDAHEVLAHLEEYFPGITIEIDC